MRASGQSMARIDVIQTREHIFTYVCSASYTKLCFRGKNHTFPATTSTPSQGNLKLTLLADANLSVQQNSVQLCLPPGFNMRMGVAPTILQMWKCLFWLSRTKGPGLKMSLNLFVISKFKRANRSNSRAKWDVELGRRHQSCQSTNCQSERDAGCANMHHSSNQHSTSECKNSLSYIKIEWTMNARIDPVWQSQICRFFQIILGGPLLFLETHLLAVSVLMPEKVQYCFGGIQVQVFLVGFSWQGCWSTLKEKKKEWPNTEPIRKWTGLIDLNNLFIVFIYCTVDHRLGLGPDWPIFSEIVRYICSTWLFGFTVDGWAGTPETKLFVHE